MIKRIISASVLALLIIPIVIYGRLPFDILIYLIAVFSLNEFLQIKEKKKALPNFIKIISFIMFLLVIFSFNDLDKNIFIIDVRTILALLLVFLIPTVLYHNKEIYSINDAFYLIGSILFLGITFSSIIYLRHISFNLLFYVILIAVATDTYAYFGGYFIGKHKLIKEVSPNKTWEGTIVGTLFCVLVCSFFYINFVKINASIISAVGITLFLSILGQFGDLVFSAIKRYYEQKDYSNLIPGHGGILDRLDSITFIVLGLMFIITII